MLIKVIIFLFVFYFGASQLPAQTPLIIKEKSSDVFLSFKEKSLLPVGELEKLESNLYLLTGADLNKDYLVGVNMVDSLRNHFAAFKQQCKNISTDSALVLFNQWYLHFSNTFYDYFKQEFFSSKKRKIILFSTSMSCYCTLEMSKNQAVDIINFVRENYDEYDYWIVDSYEHNELQIEYETLFAPSVLLFNSNNEVIHKIQYEEAMIEQLMAFINGNHKSKG